MGRERWKKDRERWEERDGKREVEEGDEGGFLSDIMESETDNIESIMLTFFALVVPYERSR
tara:strand:- start:1787 stop:1969 length:183 start_codon:yes stop_codon:yes gene_type:complete